MSVLTLAGKAINWSKPPKATAKVKWSGKTASGKDVIGSLRTIAWLDELNKAAIAKWGVGITVIQPPYNKGVAASAGTHDYDACLDIWVSGVDGYDLEWFVRQRGGAGWFRTRAQGFSPHVHVAVLPPAEGVNVSDDYRVAGFVVGKFVDGGYSLYGRKIYSSQIEDYYNHRTGLSGHAKDPSQFPANIRATIFNLNTYIERQKTTSAVKPKPVPSRSANIQVTTNNVMSLPKNKKISETLLATPHSSVLMLQEMDLPSFHNALRNLPGYTTGSIPAGDTFNAFVAFKSNLWEHVSTEFVKQYDGVGGVSKTRHIAITVLRNKTLGREFAFLAYHRVTAGNGKTRKRLRAEGDAAVTKILKRFKASGTPIILGMDQNGTGNLFKSRSLHVRHGIDHLYYWNGNGVTFKAVSDHTVNTASDHDALASKTSVTVK